MTAGWRESGLQEDFARDYLGVTATGHFGVPYQLQQFNSFGLTASFFVEALHECVVGSHWLRQMVDDIQASGQEVQLHIHPEWLKWASNADLPRPRGSNMKDFNAEEQRPSEPEGGECIRRLRVSSGELWRELGNTGCTCSKRDPI